MENDLLCFLFIEKCWIYHTHMCGAAVNHRSNIFQNNRHYFPSQTRCATSDWVTFLSCSLESCNFHFTFTSSAFVSFPRCRSDKRSLKRNAWKNFFCAVSRRLHYQFLFLMHISLAGEKKSKQFSLGKHKFLMNFPLLASLVCLVVCFFCWCYGARGFWLMFRLIEND